MRKLITCFMKKIIFITMFLFLLSMSSVHATKTFMIVDSGVEIYDDATKQIIDDKTVLRIMNAIPSEYDGIATSIRIRNHAPLYESENDGHETLYSSVSLMSKNPYQIDIYAEGMSFNRFRYELVTRLKQIQEMKAKNNFIDNLKSNYYRNYS